MRPLLALALCCASFSFLQAQEVSSGMARPSETTPPSKPVPPPPTGRIIGTVFCADTHRPARGAVINLQAKPADGGNSGNHVTRVGMGGSYSLDQIPPGEYAVVATLPGYLSPFDGMLITLGADNIENEIWKRMSQHGSVTVRENSTTKFDIELQRGAAISGRILYSDGSPATQVTMAVENINAKTEIDSEEKTTINLGALMRAMFTHQSFATDDEGHFRISGLPAGSYRIVAIHPSDIFSQRDQEGMAMTGLYEDHLAFRVYGGDTLHRNDAKKFDLRAGDVLSGITITIPIEAFHAISGHLLADDGRSLNIADLILTDPSDESFSMRTKLQPDGSFRFPSIPAGTYTLSSKNARIGEMTSREVQPGQFYAELVAKAAFADGNQSLIVKDADLTDLNIALKEVPLPPDADKQTPPPNPPEPATQTVEPQ